MATTHEQIVERIRTLLPVDLCAISILEGGGSLRVVADVGGEAFGAECGRRLPAGAGVTGRAIAAGAPWSSADVLHDPRVDLPEPMRSAVRESGMRALVAVPLRAQGRVVGALTVADTISRVFRPRELTLLEAFADHAAATIAHEQRAVEAAATEARYRELFENANDIVFTLDLAGRLTSLNRAGERVLGYSYQEAASRALGRALVAAPGSLESWILRRLDKPAAAVHEVEVVAHDGTVIPLEVSTVVVRAGEWPIGVQGIARDVTDRRRGELRFVQAHRMEALGQLAAGIAHDFNNFLAVVLGQSELIEKALDARDPIRPSLALIRGAAERAISLTRQLLAFTRRQPLELQTLDLNALITPLLALMWPLLSRAIVVETSLAPDLGHVSADAGQIEQVIMNLVLNARDAMPEGGRISLTTANVDVSPAFPPAVPDIRPGRYVRLTVTDTGTGMTPEVKARAFEPFFTTKASGEGSGLGLSTVDGIVTQHDGVVRVDSEPGRGTSFWIYLPRAEAETD